ncbi:MAG: hypothetical protein O2931_15485 [Planctomycetota bacterium]|nr:hypothetical protein [Planctomycetota bacterium]MDA1180185.1 hypothetical protein [Planctomycetota bacterium]
MAIQVKCSCGKSFAAKDELKGKKAKCPACSQVLVIGAVPSNDRTGTSRERTGTSPAAPTTSGTLAIACACGKKIAAPVKFAGKQVKCPACGKGLVVPAMASSPGDDPHGLSALLDEIGYDQEKTKDSCPECNATLAPESVICVSCGLNLETGKTLRTKNYAELAKKRINRTRLK